MNGQMAWASRCPAARPRRGAAFGPGFGYRPVMVTDPLTTAAAFRLMSSSALTRCRSA